MNIGDQLNDFQFKATSGLEGRLSDYKGQWIVLYFYPRDATPGCTIEGQDFRDKFEMFKANNAIILGVSRDKLTSHERFKCKQAFPFDLIADEEETVCQLFDVMRTKSMYGKQVRGIERSTFLIDPDGRLKKMWRKVVIPGHVDEVLNAVINKGL